jgi:DNA-binding MarR family transcriptional regulator
MASGRRVGVLPSAETGAARPKTLVEQRRGAIAMVASSSGMNLQELAQNLFDVVTRFCLLAPQGRRRSEELKEIEFLTLSLLHRHEPLIVGDIQRQLGILPAQMSRIIRALETRERPLIACRINPHDKRKVDVVLTPEGLAAFREHQLARVRTLVHLLGRLEPEDLDGLGQLLDKLQAENEIPVLR